MRDQNGKVKEGKQDPGLFLCNCSANCSAITHRCSSTPSTRWRTRRGKRRVLLRTRASVGVRVARTPLQRRAAAVLPARVLRRERRHRCRRKEGCHENGCADRASAVGGSANEAVGGASGRERKETRDRRQTSAGVSAGRSRHLSQP